MSALRLFTSESVTEGHPDKICDQIQRLDPRRAAHRRPAQPRRRRDARHDRARARRRRGDDLAATSRSRRSCASGSPSIGYDSSDVWFDGRSCGVSVSIGGQSPDIAQGVDDAFETRERPSVDELDRQGAGDQGIMFGYATRETPELMPAADLARAPPRRAARRGAQAGRARLPAPRRQDPGHGRLRRHSAAAPSRRSCCRPSTRRRCRPSSCAPRSRSS